MARAFDPALAAICSAVATVFMLVDFLDQLPDSGITTSSQAPTPYTVVQVVQPLAATATVGLFFAAALVFRHLHHAATAGGHQRLPELVTFTFCASVGILQYVFFVQPAGVVIYVGAQVHALGLAAATVAFFLGMALVLVHVGAGGGRAGGAVAGDGPVVRILSKIALGAAAVLVAFVGMMNMALYTNYYGCVQMKAILCHADSQILKASWWKWNRCWLGAIKVRRGDGLKLQSTEEI